MTGEWQDRAACASDPPDYDTFFPVPDDIRTIRKAKSVCANCPVQRECLADALAWPESMDFGIRGGTTEQERWQMRERRPACAPGTGGHPGHGTTAGYRYEVRHLGETCDECRAAEARYEQGLRSQDKLAEDDHRHGTRRGYRLGCRCAPCGAAESVARNARRARAKARAK